MTNKNLLRVGIIRMIFLARQDLKYLGIIIWLHNCRRSAYVVIISFIFLQDLAISYFHWEVIKSTMCCPPLTIYMTHYDLWITHWPYSQEQLSIIILIPGDATKWQPTDHMACHMLSPRMELTRLTVSLERYCHNETYFLPSVVCLLLKLWWMAEKRVGL